MAERQSNIFDAEIIVDYTSPAGPEVTHMRGALLVNSLDNLKALGVYERYVELLPRAHREVIPYTLAASWIPIELAMAHYDTCDALTLDEPQLVRMGELMAARVADTYLGSALRISRNAGMESLWAAIKQNHRLLERMYQGGGMCVMKTGPKDLILENTGLPIVASRYWRTVYTHYMRAVGDMFTKVTYVRLVRPRVAHPRSIAISASWV